MRRIRVRDDESSAGGVIASLAVGALAGFAVGVLVAQKMGGLSGITARIKARMKDAGDLMAGDEEFDEDELADDDDEEGSDDDIDAELEESVLAAFRDDDVLSERSIDIGAVGTGIIELAGNVDTEEESERAVAVARAVEGVETVVNRLVVGVEESLLDENARRFAEGDPALNEAQWEGNRVGIGQRRQGSSAEPDRHASPKPELEERWMRDEDAMRNSAEEIETGGEKKRSARQTRRGGRNDGSPVSPSGVPKADHVANPEDETRAD
ncbi:MAG: BON domain-containing protein [Gemmatimonadota bacterium]|nr:BON domain-containing protein [Gemmatimonadota bacterium]